MRYFSLFLFLSFLFLLTSGRVEAQETLTDVEKARAAQFLTPPRLAHAARVAWKTERDHARTFPNMPKAFDGPVAINVQSFKDGVERATGKTLDQKALMKKFRPMMQGKHVKTDVSPNEDAVSMDFGITSYRAIEETENGYKIEIQMKYDNSSNMKGSSYDHRYPIVWLYYEQRNGKWRIVDTKIGQLVP